MSNTVVDTAPAFLVCNVTITDKAERAASRWAEATEAGDILAQSFFQCALSDLIGGDAAIAVLSVVGASL